MCLVHWIVPFVLGVFVGQEVENLPKVKPWLQTGLDRFVNFSTEAIRKYSDNKKD